MPKFDVTYKYSVIGVKTVDVDNPTDASKSVLNELSNRPDNEVIRFSEAAVYHHDEKVLNADLEFIAEKKEEGYEVITAERRKL